MSTGTTALFRAVQNNDVESDPGSSGKGRGSQINTMGYSPTLAGSRKLGPGGRGAATQPNMQILELVDRTESATHGQPSRARPAASSAARPPSSAPSGRRWHRWHKARASGDRNGRRRPAPLPDRAAPAADRPARMWWKLNPRHVSRRVCRVRGPCVSVGFYSCPGIRSMMELVKNTLPIFSALCVLCA